MTDLVKVAIGVGLVGLGSVSLSQVNLKKKKVTEVEITTTEETVEENPEVQICKEIPNGTITVDSKKLGEMLEEAGMTHDNMVDFVNNVAANASPEIKNVEAEIVNPKFTVIQEEKKKIPNFSNTSEKKKSNNKKK